MISNKLGIATTLLSLPAAFSLQAELQPQRHNVLFIIADDLTAETITGYDGIHDSLTPNITRLANRGTLFRQAFSQYPVSGPSRASFMFGYYPYATKTYGYESGRAAVGAGRASWSEHFKNNGYYAARVSKIYHMGVPVDIYNGSDGEDDAASWAERYNCQGLEAASEGIKEFLSDGSTSAPSYGGGTDFITVKGSNEDVLYYSDGKAAAKASDLIRAHKDENFFLALGFVRPHVPFVAPESYFDQFPLNGVQLPEKVADDQSDIPPWGINYKTTANMGLDETEQKKSVQGYKASVKFVDDMVGNVLDTLEAEGLQDNTIVIFTSDHGYHLGEHDFWQKVGLMDESSKVPLIISVPGQTPAVCDSFVELVDLYPTVSELCGLEVPTRLQGKSLKPLLEDHTATVRDAAFSMHNYSGRLSFLLRTKKWAFIQHALDGSQGIQLYDMENDPQQYTNLASDPTHADTVAAFEAQLQTRLEEIETNDLNSSGSTLHTHWRFDGDTLDASGNGHTGTITGEPTFTEGGKDEGAFIRLDDTEYVARTGVSDIGEAFSISLWARQVGTNANSYGLFNGGAYDGENHTSFQIDSYNGSYRFVGSNSGTFGAISNDWVHLVATCDGTNITLYYNGSKIHSFTAGPLDKAINQLAVGVNRGMSTSFRGDIDDFRIYNGAITLAEVQDLYQNFKPIPFEAAHYSPKAVTTPNADLNYLTFGYNGVTGGNPRTVEMWVKIPNVSENLGIFSCGRYQSGTSYYGKRLDLRLQSSGELRMEISGDGLDTTQKIDDNQWHHIALVVKNSTDVELYIDGELDASKTLTKTMNTDPHTEGIRIFRGSPGVYDSYGVTGMSIDSFRYWSMALTQEQLQQVINNEIEDDGNGKVAVVAQTRTTPLVDGLNWADLQVYTTLDGKLADSSSYGRNSIESSEGWTGFSSTPAFGIEVVQTDNLLTWTVESEPGVQKYLIVNSATDEVIATVMAGAGTYSYELPEGISAMITVVDSNGHKQSFYPNDGSQVTIPYNLKHGWNLISLPLEGADIDPLRKKAAGFFWGWDGEKYYTVDTPNSKQGFWVYNSGPLSKVDVTGKTLAENQIPLNSGWSLIGPCANGVMRDNQHVNAIFTWNDIYEQILNENNALVQGAGYWIFSLQPTILEFE